MLNDDAKEKIILDFQKDMFQTVWSFALKREGQFVLYLAQVAMAIGTVVAALAHIEYLFLAQFFALLVLCWGAAIAVSTNYDYRINQALAWALEMKFCARKDIIPHKFGLPKGDLIWLHKIHLLTFMVISFGIVLIGFVYNKSIQNYLNWVAFIVWLILFFLIILLIVNRSKQFDNLFNDCWKSKVKLLLESK